MSTESSEGGGDESLALAVADAAEPRLSASAPPGFRNSVRRRLSSLLLRDSSVISEVHLPPGRTAGQVVVQVLDSLPLQLFSLLLVVFTLFAAVRTMGPMLPPKPKDSWASCSVLLSACSLVCFYHPSTH